MVWEGRDDWCTDGDDSTISSNMLLESPVPEYNIIKIIQTIILSTKLWSIALCCGDSRPKCPHFRETPECVLIIEVSLFQSVLVRERFHCKDYTHMISTC